MRLSPAAFKPRKQNAPRPAEKSCLGFKQWCRGRPCACGGRNPDCGGKMEFAHGPDPATKGIGTKSTDTVGMPLSSNCHRRQHAMGWGSFAARYLMGPAADVCGLYFKTWLSTPMGRNWQAKQDG